jgi:hypothetical protein
MKKPVEIWQAVIATALLLVTVVSIIINQSNRITRDEAEILTLEKNNDKTDQQFNKVNDNLDRVNSRLTDILVELQNKQNRK